jgi:hypothetical protein
MIEPQSTTRAKKPELIYDDDAIPVKGMNLTGWKQKKYRRSVCQPNCIARRGMTDNYWYAPETNQKFNSLQKIKLYMSNVAK